ncbi:hypothetical protein C2845_PM17G14900 [Panicum miliaceum]|uniref:NADH:flavin oxidoreductase/NADH oxidase N-terminal domain-containing protein n=1 Tax=Panicum miliaceum TaxID=4540 RepID=A0A3L6Q1S0_PANMI|nr:hypothetical protein C2845_PM17G14900 [Panicum miliaceum]
MQHESKRGGGGTRASGPRAIHRHGLKVVIHRLKGVVRVGSGPRAPSDVRMDEICTNNIHNSLTVVLAPVTRCRSYENLAQPHNSLYYQQRAPPGVLLIAEASAVSETATGYPGVPGLWSDDQVSTVWRSTLPMGSSSTSSFIFLDIGRVDSSQPLRLDPRYTKDGLSDGSRSLEDRCRRLATDVVAAVVDEVGAHRVGLRLSPFAGGDTDSTNAAEAHALHLVCSMDRLGVLCCHVVEPRTRANGDGDGKKPAIPHRLSPFREAFRGTFIVNGGYDREEGDRAVSQGYADLVSYGRLFLANPDLPERFRKKAELNRYDRSTFYTSDPVVGYTDYPFLGQETQVA